MRCSVRLALSAGLVVLTVSVAVAFRSASPDQEDEKDDNVVVFSSVPQPAQRALLKAAGKAKIERIEKESDDGLVVYEGLWRVAGVEHEACVSADGQLLERETSVGDKDVPAAVRKAVAAKLGKTRVKYERKMIVVYEAEVEIDGKERSFLLSPVGQRMEVEIDDDEDDEEDGDEDDDKRDEARSK